MLIRNILQKINRFCGMNKAAYYKYSYWGVVQSTKYIIGRLEINFSIFIKKQQNYINF